MAAPIRLYRADLAYRALERLQHPTVQRRAASTCLLSRNLSRHTAPSPRLAYQQLRHKSEQVPLNYEPRLSRWIKYENPNQAPNVKPEVRNPLNYFEKERARVRYNSYLKQRMYLAGLGLGVCLAAQFFLVFTFGDEPMKAKEKREAAAANGAVETLDARSPNEGEPGFPSGGKVHVVGQKPGVPGVALDEHGNELVETGNSTIPYFPRTIRLPTTGAADAPPTSGALPAAASAEAGRQDEEYTLLGHGVRTVSFLSIQVYYMGVYVRTSDLPELQRRFVAEAAGNASASSLIPPEKAKLRERLLDGEGSREVWDRVLREVGVRSAMRIVPVRNTDFGHLRDGWVRGITTQTQEATRRAMQEKREGPGEYDDERFGEAVGSFKGLLQGKGKAPVGSVMILAKDESGNLAVSYQNAPTKEEKEKGVIVPRQDLGRISDERVARLLWLVYLGGKNVSSEPARRSVVDGVMELVERPVGTVGVQVA